MSVRTLIIGGITVPVWACTDLRQSYEPIEVVYQSRKRNGALVYRELYSGLIRTQLSGGGLAPSGLQALVAGATVSLSCIKPMAINSASNVIDIPAARRSDAGSEPQGFAVVGDIMLPTPVAMNVNEATLTTVAGASAYQVRWYPVLSVIVTSRLEDELSRGAGFRWSLVAEEV